MNNTATTIFELDGLKVNSDFEFDKEIFNKLYSQGMSASNDSFGYQFANKCSEFAALFVAEKSCTLKEASNLLGKVLFSLNDTHLAYGLDVYKKKLEETGDINLTHYRKLTAEANMDIFAGMMELEKDNSFNKNILVNVLTMPDDKVFRDKLLREGRITRPRETKSTNEPLNARIETKDDGSVFIYNDKNQLHAQGIPAVTLADGTQQWFLEGIETTQDLNKKQVMNNINNLRNPPVSTNRYTKN